MTATPQPRANLLDRPIARLIALVIFLLMAASLAWIHREDLLPGEPDAVSADDPVAQCLAQRAEDIEQMRRDGVIDEDQAALFKSRAEALCQAQVGQGAGPPPPQ